MQNYMKTILSGIQTWVKGKIKQSTADWNQNDSSADNYIKNRIGYMEVSDTPYISEQTITEYYDFNDVYYCSLPRDSFEFIEGQPYIVYWDGVSYSVIGQYQEDYSSYWYLGNSSIHQYMPITKDNDMPFLIVKEHEPEYGTYWQVWTKDNNPHTFSVYEVKAHKIDMALLPNTNPLVINDVFYDGTNRTEVVTGALRGTGEASAVLNFRSITDYEKSRASGICSCAEGENTIAGGNFSHAGGLGTQALARNQYVFGKYNIPSEYKPCASNKTTLSYYDDKEIIYANNYIYDPVTRKITFDSPIKGTWKDISTKIVYFTFQIANTEYTNISYKPSATYSLNSVRWKVYDIEEYIIMPEPKYVCIIGNGEYNNPSNAHTLDWEGNAWYAGDVYVGSTSGKNKDEGSVKLATIDDLNSSAAQSDWNQNDPEARDYIKNKTHWEEIIEDGILFEGKVEGSDGTFVDLGIQLDLEQDKQYKVIVNGIEHILTSYWSDTDGDTISFADIGFECYLHDTPDGVENSAIWTNDDISFTLKLIDPEKEKIIVHHLDPKFIKDMYYEEAETVVWTPKQTFVINESGNANQLLRDDTVEWAPIGAEYEVIFDGATYTGTVWKDSNECFRTDFITVDGIPVYVYDGNLVTTPSYIGDPTSLAGEHTIQINYFTPGYIKTIDPKYLPEVYATKEELNNALKNYITDIDTLLGGDS